MFKKTLCQVITLLLLCTSAFAKGGYKITLRTTPDTLSHSYILSMYQWGGKVGVDTVRGETQKRATEGTIVFSNHKDLPCGQYVIEKSLDGKTSKLMEFMVSPNTINQVRNSIFNLSPTAIYQEKGSMENQIYTNFQNLIDSGWKKLKTKTQLNDTINGVVKKVEKECPGSLFEMMLKNALSTHDSPKEMLQKFPFGDSLIINTSFGKTAVKQYLKAIELNPNDTITNLVNKMIADIYPGENQKGSLRLQALVAAAAFDHFYHSNIMGQEGVAVKIAQEWFLNEKLEWPDKEGLFMLKTFVSLNKQSLIGMQAPPLDLIDTLGNKIALNSLVGDYTILYFYTDDCSTCKIETPKLVDFINEYKEGVLSVYAVYAQDNTAHWKTYINHEFNLYNPFVEWVNVYDPQFESGFHILYNVISTPQMFLLDKDKKIIGRNLKVDSLKELLNAKNKERDDLYQFFGNFFSKLGELDSATVQMGIDAFYQKSIDKPELFREIFKELYNFLRLSPDYLLQQGATYLGKKYIIEKEELWPNKNFTEQVKKGVEIFNMNPLGGKAANLTLESINGSPLNLYDIKNDYKILYFYKINCGICEIVSKELQKLHEDYKNNKNIDIEFVAINTGKDYNQWVQYVAQNGFSWIDVWGGDENEQIYRHYYLENVPSIYLLKDNTVIAKDINDIDLKNLLKTILQEK